MRRLSAERTQPALDVGVGHGPVPDLVGAEGTEQAKQVGHPFGVAGPAVGGEALELGLDLGEDLGIEQLAQLGAAEELGEQPLVEGQRGRPALGDRGVALVDELGDVAEQQGAGVRRRLLGRDVDHRDLAAVDAAHQGDEGREVVDVLEALADRFEDDREGGVLHGDLEELGRALTLLPQRAASPGVAARQQQRPGRTLPEAGREERGAADLVGHHRLDLVGLEDHHLAGRGLGVGLGDADDDAVVGGDRLAVDAVPLAQTCVDRQRPGGVHGRAVGGVDHQPPVAELVAEPLDEDRGVAGHDLGRRDLFADVAHQVGRRVVVEAAVGGARLRGGDGQGRELTGEGPDRLAELGGPTERVALPERQPPRDPRRRRDQHPVVGDVLDAPAGGAQGEDVAHAGLVDHLLVQLADPAAPRSFGGRACRDLASHEEDPEEATVGDGAAAGDRQALGAGAAGEPPGHPVPHDPRAELGELVAGVAARQQVEGGVVRAARERAERGAAPHEVVELVDVPGVDRGRRHDLLGQHVERVGRDPQ